MLYLGVAVRPVEMVLQLMVEAKTAESMRAL